MKICITSQEATLDSLAEERFGRAPFFIIVDMDTGSCEAIENQFAGGSGGVGPKAAQLIMAQKVSALVSGIVGGNAREVLIAAGIHLYTYHAGGTVRDALDQFNKKTLERIA
jgi:predicted Fe-Mo cluster-binding NifX family protein